VARPLSLLDLTPIPSTQTAEEALRDATGLAQLAERLGYHRVWYSEHHNTVGLASGSPEIMIAHVASHTRHIRVGSGGVMLPNHAPLAVAERFRLLNTLYPGRIDLGIGRAPGTDPRTAGALRRIHGATGDDQPELLDDLIAFDQGSFPPGHAWHGIRAVPTEGMLPPIWLLGSSDFSARLAAREGLGFAFAAHINTGAADIAMHLYRQHFQPSPRCPRPHAILTMSVVVGETEQEARDQALIGDLVLLRMRTGLLGKYPTLAEAKAYPFTDQERMAIDSMGMGRIVGTPDQVRDQLDAFATRTGADELMVTTRVADPADRRRTITLLADAFARQVGITPAAD